jgi:PBP1b-binding outer membrane lipoprotein LpoB
MEMMIMKNRLFPTPSTALRTSLLLLALLLASCAPAAVTDAPTQPAAPVAVEPTSEAAAPAPLPVATSRGPDLHATDPGTVNLASGQLQFVEFFRFT